MLIRSTVGIGAAAPCLPPLVDHDRQRPDRVLPVLLRQRRGPRNPHHHRLRRTITSMSSLSTYLELFQVW